MHCYVEYMTSHIIGFFCGTEYTLTIDESYQHVKSKLVNSEDTLWGYDGCQVHGGGLFAFGVEDQADAFVAKLKNTKIADKVQINFIAHSRGVFSAILAIKKIQADPELRDKVTVTADFRDPVPGNFQITAQVSNLAMANIAHDLRDCTIINQVHITLQEKPIAPIGFDALIPKFHPTTIVEIETLPGYHDAQQRINPSPYNHDALVKLGHAKTLSILKDDGHLLDASVEPLQYVADGNGVFVLQPRTLEKQQLDTYRELVIWAKERDKPFGERDLHFGGKIIANNGGKINIVNWRHARLESSDTPIAHILYGTNHPDYNYRKNQTEINCDLTLALNKYLEKYPPDNEATPGWIMSIKNAALDALMSDKSDDQCALFQTQCKTILSNARVNDTNITKALNAICMKFYFNELENLISDTTRPTAIEEALQFLHVELYMQLDAEIQSGKSVDQIANSSVLNIINNTVQYIGDALSKDSMDEIIQMSQQYVKENIRLGRDWNLGAKIIVGAVVCLAAAIVGCAVGAAIGIGIGFAIGAISGPGAFITACVGAFVGGLKGAMIAATCAGTAVGFGAGIGAANYFFSPSKTDKRINSLIDAVTSQDDIATSPENLQSYA